MLNRAIYTIPTTVIGSQSTRWTTNANAAASVADAPNSMRADIEKKSKVPMYPGELGISVDRVPEANANHGP